MSFAILRHGKLQGSSMGAAISHNHRTGNRVNSPDAVNIDHDRTHLNRDFIGSGTLARMKALLPKKHRKDAVVSVEMLVSASPEFFNGIEPDREKLAKNPTFNAWVDESVGWLKKEFGDNLIDVVLHMDESSPHIQAMFVPLTKDGRLCAKEVVGKMEMKRRQSEYHKAVAGFGLQRGESAEVTKREHVALKDKSAGGVLAKTQAQNMKLQAELKTVVAERSDLIVKYNALADKFNRNLEVKKQLKAENDKLIATVQHQAETIELAKKIIPRPKPAPEPAPSFEASPVRAKVFERVVEASKPVPQPEISLKERIKRSIDRMVEWVKKEFGPDSKMERPRNGVTWEGRIVQVDDIHVLQNVGRNHVLYQHAELNMKIGQEHIGQSLVIKFVNDKGDVLQKEHAKSRPGLSR